MQRITDRLEDGPVDVRELVDSFYPYDMEANGLVQRLFHVGVLCGTLHWTHVTSRGRIAYIADATPPVWH